MTFVVTEACIRCKYTDCAAVCPVDCFYEGETMLVINPEECIDCGVCEPECPAEAIVPDSDPRALASVAPNEATSWAELNRDMAGDWPNITRKKDGLPDADDHKAETGKYEKYFSAEPGKQ